MTVDDTPNVPTQKGVCVKWMTILEDDRSEREFAFSKRRNRHRDA